MHTLGIYALKESMLCFAVTQHMRTELHRFAGHIVKMYILHSYFSASNLCVHFERYM